MARIGTRRRSRGLRPLPSVVAISAGAPRSTCLRPRPSKNGVVYHCINTVIVCSSYSPLKATVFSDSATLQLVPARPCEEHL